MTDAIPFLVPCAIIAVMSIPLMLGIVPPNGVYGFRTRQTLADRELWFRANRFLGWALFIASGLSVAIFAAFPEHASGQSLVGLAVFVGPVAAAVGAGFVYVRRATRKASV